MDRPILFSGPMVRALLDGRKTQTRRVLLPQPYPLEGHPGFWNASGVVGGRICISDRALLDLHRKPKPGDRLYVREAWCSDTRNDSTKPSEIATTEPIWFAADAAGINITDWSLKSSKNRPGIFLPRWASRITLTVTDVRVQRLLDISEEDARAEGFADGPLGDPIPETDIGGGWTVSSPGGWASAAGHFQVYWSQLHPDWDGFSSPWVVAITFTVERRNIDEAA